MGKLTVAEHLCYSYPPDTVQICGHARSSNQDWTGECPHVGGELNTI